MISWNVLARLAEKEQQQDAFDLQVAVGKQRPLFYLKKFCPSCKDKVYINRLFPDCIFCDFKFGVDWERAWLHNPDKIFNNIVDGHESLDGKKIRGD